MIFMLAWDMLAAVIVLGAGARHLARAALRHWRGTRALPAAPPPPPPPPPAPRPGPPSRPEGDITLHVLPCGCIYYYRRVNRDPCPPHARTVAERDEINRLDQQIRRMP